MMQRQAESEGARMHTLMALKRRYDEGRPVRRLEKSMGYKKGEDGEFYPDDYAPLVLEMYEMAADGYTTAQITNYLNAEGIKNHHGCVFNRGSVMRLLRNPVYPGRGFSLIKLRDTVTDMFSVVRLF